MKINYVLHAVSSYKIIYSIMYDYFKIIFQSQYPFDPQIIKNVYDSMDITNFHFLLGINSSSQLLHYI